MDTKKRIEELLHERNWTAYRLAQEAEIPQSTLSNLFNRPYEPTVYTLETICKGFGITLSQFFAVEGEPFTLTPEQYEMLRNWDKLTEIQKQKLVEFLKVL